MIEERLVANARGRAQLNAAKMAPSSMIAFAVTSDVEPDRADVGSEYS